MLTGTKNLLEKARVGKYAIGCFNTSDLEITKAIIAAAETLHAPVIVATSERAIEYGGLESLSALIQAEAVEADIPVALHLDHGSSLALLDRCLEAGYTSVMLDGSKNNLMDNIILTRQAVEMAHAQDVTCEGELGNLGKAGVNPSQLTNPDDVLEFVQGTGVDSLAVSIGSQHGSVGQESEKLDIGLLKRIASKTSLPLVLHGASGVRNGDITSAVAAGVAKINIDTDIRHTFSDSIKKVIETNPDEEDPREIMIKVMIAIQKLVQEKIRLFGSQNKA